MTPAARPLAFNLDAPRSLGWGLVRFEVGSVLEDRVRSILRAPPESRGDRTILPCALEDGAGLGGVVGVAANQPTKAPSTSIRGSPPQRTAAQPVRSGIGERVGLYGGGRYFARSKLTRRVDATAVGSSRVSLESI